MDTVKIISGKTKMIAHRGVCGLERENTCAAFVAAGNRSYFGVETDVHVTKDGKFVIIHDETTERVTTGVHNINVEENDYSALEDVIITDLDGTRVRTDLRIPLLEEYIKICKKYNKICVLEVKNHFEEDDLYKMLDEIEGMDYIDSMIFISFDFENCVNIRKRLPKSKVQWLTDKDVNEEMVQMLLENKLDLDIYFKKLDAENVKYLHSNGIEVNCWTCDEKEDAEKLVQFGVDYITTDILE